MHHGPTTSALVALALATLIAACGGGSDPSRLGGAAEPGPATPLGAKPTTLTREPATARPTRSTANLDGTAWVLMLLKGDSPVKGSRVSLRFEEGGQVRGSGGCNSYFGKYAVRHGSALTISGVASTEEGCVGPSISEQEVRYFETLQRAAGYRITDQRLEISDAAGGIVLVFVRGKSRSTADKLNRTGWVLASLRGKRPVGGTDVTLGFVNGQVSGSSGCNSYSADYIADDGALDIGDEIMHTLVACDPVRLMDQEGSYLKALQEATSYRVVGRRLEIRNSNGDTILILVKDG